jgi:alkanesulfonate monooxygenase SsuD/methylene tetrahydromethanopterin reductase-like flavin-dependent oxidoreductase (luciferase family)
MKFSFSHLMPWPYFPTTGEDWPVSNKSFEPEKATGVYEEYISAISLADECGFDWVSCNEHHMSPYGLMPNPNLLGAILTQRTKKARILMSGNIVPLLNPIRVAEEYAMLDCISGGRLIAGFMRGIPHEYVAYNVPPNDSWSRLREACALIKKAWTAPEPFGWEGEHYQFRAVSIWPKPRQKPHPRIILSASSPQSARFAAEQGAMAGIVRVTDLDTVANAIGIYRQRAKECGWDPTPDDIMVGMYCSIADTADEAKKNLDLGLSYFVNVLGGGIRTAQRLVVQKTRYYENDENKEVVTKRAATHSKITIEERIENGIVLCGTPDQVIDQVKRIHKKWGHGITSVNMKVGKIPEPAVRRSLELFRDHVRPALADL